MSDRQLMPTDELDDQQTLYYFSSGWEPNSRPLVELTKSWPTGEVSLIVGYYDRFQQALDAETELLDLRSEKGLEATMHEAERRAVAAGTLDPTRADGRLFSDGPPDPFTSLRQQEIAGTTYTYDVVTQPQGVYELEAIKLWDVAGDRGMESLPLGQYDRQSDAREEQSMLQEIRGRSGLEAEMQAVERIAIENGSLDPQRADPRLFQEGPPDPFTTLRQQELEQNQGYFFRAGPALDGAEANEVSLNLVNVERMGTEYEVSQAEFMRVGKPDGDYVIDAADKFNRMLQEEGTGPSVAAAATWAREHGAEPSLDWQTVDMARFDRGSLAVIPRQMDDTQPVLPASGTSHEIDF